VHGHFIVGERCAWVITQSEKLAKTKIDQKELSMWFMNKITNPIVRLILLSPLYRLLSSSLLLISYRGRKSGKEYTLPVQYAQTENCIYILPGMPEQKTWWRNLKGDTQVRVTLAGQTVAANGRLLEQESEEETIVKSLDLYLQHFPALAKSLKVSKDGAGHFNAADLRAASAGLVMIRVELSPK
jgi:deazaflavin-dependent oxidoreductase (nitroreductase family)